MKTPEKIISRLISEEWRKDPTINTNATSFKIDEVMRCIDLALIELNQKGDSFEIVEGFANSKPNSTSRYSREFICSCINNLYKKKQ